MSQQEKQKMLEFGIRAKNLRQRMNLSQVEFGKKLGVSDEYVSQIEKGKRDPGEGLKLLVGELEGKFQLHATADSNSVEPGLADAPRPADYATIEQCRERIKELEGRNAVLEAMVMAALKLRPISYRGGVSSTTSLSEDQVILKQDDENEEARQRAARRQK